MRNLLPQIDLPLSVLLSTPLFILFFVGVVIWAFWGERKKIYERLSNVPLEKD